MSSVAILQPNYLPWKGVFDLINRVDYFVFFDDVQYTKKDWRNRNRFKTHSGVKWLSVPVLTPRRDLLIKDVLIENKSRWAEKHHKTLCLEYAKAAHFSETRFLIDRIFEPEWSSLCDLNIFSTKIISEYLGIEVEWICSSDLGISGAKDGERILRICEHLGCDEFINGPSAKSFTNEQLFSSAGVDVSYMDYCYPEYEQLHGDFVHEVSVLDVLFNCGPNSGSVIFYE